jgi:enoyl-[acyl-carrier-protein] reductase (NADH)
VPVFPQVVEYSEGGRLTAVIETDLRSGHGVGNAATFLASDRTGATTGPVFNMTSGTVVGQVGT